MQSKVPSGKAVHEVVPHERDHALAFGRMTWKRPSPVLRHVPLAQIWGQRFHGTLP